MTALYSTRLPHETTRTSAEGARPSARRQAFRQSNKALWTGRVLSGLISALLLTYAPA